jgi:Nuclease-related domain
MTTADRPRAPTWIRGRRHARWLSFREQSFGSDSRTGRYARNLAWRNQIQPLLRRAWWLLVLMPVLFTVALLPLALQVHGSTRAFVFGASVTSGFWLDVLGILMISGASSTLMGIVGESWTATELRRLQRLGWRLVNGFQVSDGWDIDHVLVGPGGVLIVESKWSRDPWSLSSGDRNMQDRREKALGQARRNAADIERWLDTAGVGSRIPVMSVAVLWSGSVDHSGSGWDERSGGLGVIVHGPDLRKWLALQLPQSGLRNETRDLVFAHLVDVARTRDTENAKAGNAAVPTAGQLVWEWVGKPGFGVIIAAGAAWMISLLRSWRLEPPVEGLMVLLAIWATRVGPIRRVAIGWMAASVVWFLADIALVLFPVR